LKQNLYILLISYSNALPRVFILADMTEQEANTEFRLTDSKKEATWCEIVRRLEDNINYLKTKIKLCYIY